MIFGRAVSLVNGRIVVPDGTATAIRFTSRIVSIERKPHRTDTVIDLNGATVLPGLINAHDHLELNHYGRLKFRDRYQNATQWIDDMRPHLVRDRAIRVGSRYPLTERLFIGGLKNLLAGVTTVVHHNPYYRELERTMPIRVLRRYGWAHSFALERQPAGARGEPGGIVTQRWRRTPAAEPFFVHLGEGIDADARAELSHLDESGCLARNTAIVHGVAIDVDGFRRMAAQGAGLVWCPASNLFLLGRTAPVRAAMSVGCRVALGTDSRLTGANDLLDELRVARDTGCANGPDLLAMVTTSAAAITRMPRAGRLAPGVPADIIVIPARIGHAGDALLDTKRADVRLVMVNGRPLFGDPSFAPVFRSRGVTPRPVRVDDVEKIVASEIGRRIAVCPISEPGVVVS